MTKGLNFHKIGKHHPYPAVIKLFAREFIEGASYFTVGKWFEELSQPDLDMLIEMSEHFEEHGLDGEVIFLLGEMLTAAEGVEILDLESAKKRVGHFITLLICESLYRKGNVEIDHTSFSFDEEEMKNVVAWPKGKVRPPNPPKKTK